MIRTIPTLATAAIVTACLCAQAPPARSCSCAPPGTPVEELQRMDAVFSGKVTAVSLGTAMEGNRFEVEVLDSWKGDVGSAAAVWSPTSSAACGIILSEGETYLFYVYGADCESCFHAFMCSRTGRLVDLPEDIITLDHYRANGYTPTTATTWGRIKSLHESEAVPGAAGF